MTAYVCLGTRTHPNPTLRPADNPPDLNHSGGPTPYRVERSHLDAASTNRETDRCSTMSFTEPTISALVRAEDRQLDRAICEHLGVSVDTYKAARFIFRAVAIGTIVSTAILPWATLPPTGYITLGAVALGPDVAEAYLTRNEG